jgi:protein-L-isoaspartate(D-aspartate) O-methyltransferase
MFSKETEGSRASMVAAIEADVADTARLLGKDALDPQVREAMLTVPREAFVPDDLRRFAYQNRPLPIGHGQTISQPFIVAIMTDLAHVQDGDRVLEVGTGCGYQSAILAALGARVFSIEALTELAGAAAERLEALGYDRVTVRQGNGAEGWPDEAPFDAILVTAAAPGRVPEALIRQLAPGGRMVVPVDRGGGADSFLFGPSQDLMLLIKDAQGRVEERSVLPVAFVPLV